MKKLIILITVIMLTSCASWTRIGGLTMVSTRNIDSNVDYKELTRYTEGKDKGRYDYYYDAYSGTLEGAIDGAVRQVPGGEYMRNVVVYANNGKYRVVGDVWGVRPDGYVSPEQEQKERDDMQRKIYEEEMRLKKEREEEERKREEERIASFKVGDRVLFKETFRFKRTEGVITGRSKEYATIEYKNKKGYTVTTSVSLYSLIKIE